MHSFVQRQLAKLPLHRRYCCLCNNHFASFIPYRGWRDVPKLMTALEVVGSNVEQFSCPLCYAHDRERHLFLYFSQLNLDKKINDASILHFAPEANFRKIIEAKQPRKYIRCDLYPSEPDMAKIDITNIPFAPEYFDFVLVNHVLEHVPDDLKALSELFRVLKRGGLAILQTPYSSVLSSTWSDPGIASAQAKLQAYGQEDHVRLYGKDIFARFESVGFVARTAYHKHALPDIDPVRYGVNVNEPFFLFEKTA